MVINMDTILPIAKGTMEIIGYTHYNHPIRIDGLHVISSVQICHHPH